MKYVEKEYSYIYEEKKSKFISYLIPYDNFEKKLKELKKLHPKARHFVWAYRYLKNNQIVENQTDDGEPKGTSGKPTLNVLQKQNIINSAIITVRYFGGIKLGANGLVKAYSKVASEVVKKSDFMKYKELEKIKFLVSYKNYSKIKYFIKELNIDIIKEEFLDDKALFEILLDKSLEELFKSKIDKIVTIC